MKWQPIETAPTDGTRILAYYPNLKWPQVVYYRKVSKLLGGDIKEFWASADTGKPHKAYCHMASLMGADVIVYPTHWVYELPKPEKVEK